MSIGFSFLRTIAIILSMITMLTGCGLFYTRKDFNRKSPTVLFATDADTRIEEKLNINGYYYAKESNSIFILYKDQTCISYYFKNELSDLKGLPLRDLGLLVSRKPGNLALWNKYNGIYTISGDTLTIDFYERNNIMYIQTWLEFCTDKFEILDKNTLRLFQRIDEDGKEFNGDVEYKFTPLKIVPDPYNNDLKKKKWMWKYKEDWDAYKKELKQHKKHH